MKARAFNRRRPEGYAGSPEDVLAQVEHDTRAALGYAHELRRRARLGEQVGQEILQEFIDGGFRVATVGKYAGVSLDLSRRITRIFDIDLDFEAVLREAMRILQFGETWSSEECPYGPTDLPREVDAARFIADHAGEPRMEARHLLSSPKALKSAYRRASKRLHPDLGGETAMFQRLEAAYRMITVSRN